MKQSKDELISYLKKQILKNIGDKKFNQALIREAADKFNLPEDMTFDIITLKTELQDYKERVLFYILSLYKESDVDKFFTDAEIKEYSTKYKVLNNKFPIKWNMIEIAPDQWIGSISLKELMKLRDTQLIRYNENTQRTLRRINNANNDFEYYQIYLNRSAVNAIIDSYNNGSYIPNTITLNIPESADFKYLDGQLIIKETESLDIIDGYHRYIAMSNIYNTNPKFDYQMELRVVSFSEEKARQFIWQEDQKTQMKKMDSDSFNQNDPANQVINLINQNTLLRNVINRNDGAIDMGTASALISALYFNTTKVVTRKMIIETRDSILEKMQSLLDYNPGIYDKKWDYKYTICAFYLFTEDIPAKKLLDEIEAFTDYCSTDNNRSLIGRRGAPITQKIITRIRKLYEQYKKEV